MPENPDVVAEAVNGLGGGPAIAHVVHRAMAPFRCAVWGWDKIDNYLSVTLPRILSHSKPENIYQPKMSIAGPVLLHLPFCMDEEALRDLFANLLASSMDAATRAATLPSFAHVIQQISSDEAKILTHLSQKHMRNDPIIRIRQDMLAKFAFDKSSQQPSGLIQKEFRKITRLSGCESAQNSSVYLNNLLRLKILEITSFRTMLVSGGTLEDSASAFSERPVQTEIKDLLLTEFGFAFLRICVKGPSAQ